MQKDLAAKKLTFIHITYIMPFKTSKRNSNKYLRPFQGLNMQKNKIKTFNNF